MNKSVQRLSVIAISLLTLGGATECMAISPEEEKTESEMIQIMKETEGKSPYLYDLAKKAVDSFQQGRFLEKEAVRVYKAASELAESASHRMEYPDLPIITLTVDRTDELIDHIAKQKDEYGNMIGAQKAEMIFNKGGKELEFWRKHFQIAHPEYTFVGGEGH